LPCPFLWGKVSDPSASPLVSVCCDGLLIVFQLWMLLTGSGDEFCGPLPALFQAWLIILPLAVNPSAFPAICLLKMCGDQLLAPPSFFGALIAPCPLCCVLVFSSLFIQFFVLFCFFLQQRVSLPWGLCWFIPGVAGGIPCDAWCSSVALPNVSQTGLEPASGGAGALLFSQCKVAWRSFVWARGSGC
jgi:hypothetical protein